MPHITKLTCCLTRPWYDQTTKIDWALQKLCKKEQQIDQYFRMLIANKYNIINKIYTDGSVCNSPAGYGIASQNSRYSIKLPDSSSIFSAEAIAIMIAIEEATVNDRPNVIFTDSTSVLKALEKGSK